MERVDMKQYEKDLKKVTLNKCQKVMIWSAKVR